ncbi:MAG TPA: histidine kinase [Flavipsychrobacter sp.]|nr:histidine kinase [Flavipsychrobacter sp.]
MKTSGVQGATDSFGYYTRTIDHYLSEGMIDSANHYLEKAQRYPHQQRSAEQRFFLMSRRMEVSYYYDLGKLGLVEATKNLDWALHHGTAAMIMDAYNFTGLFHFMLGNWQQSIGSYKEGLAYLNQAQSLSYETSRAYHLQNNLAESYLKTGHPDSALRYSEKAIAGAIKDRNKRMTALSLYQKAGVLAQMRDGASSDSLFIVVMQIAEQETLRDVALICLGSLALSPVLPAGQRQSYMDEGFRLLNAHNDINSFYAKDFYKQALQFYDSRSNYRLQSSILRKIAAIEDQKKAKELSYLISQYDEVISENEKRIALEKSNLQKSQDLQRLIIATSLASILVLIAALILFFLRIKRKEAVLTLRSAISRDLHDDLGSSLSSLNIYGNILSDTSALPVEKQKDVVQKITSITKDLMNNLHDIIWSLDKNTQQTSLEDLLKSYAMHMLTNNNIQVEIQVRPPVEALLTSPKARKNILMVLKEIMNNCSKYSHALHFSLHIYAQKNTLHIIATDDGRGFDATVYSLGNGLKNIQKRLREINGTVHLTTAPGKGTRTEIHVATTNIRMKEYFFKPLFPARRGS